MGKALRDAVAQWSADRSVALEHDAIDRLDTLMTLWIRYGRAMNLTSAATEAALVPHVLDGLDCVACVRACGIAPSAAWIDVGSGGGFPGLVVAAVTSHDVSLVEPRQKRAAFLDLALHAIERNTIVVSRARFDGSTWTKNTVAGYLGREKSSFMIASARAVLEPAQWLEWGSHVVEVGGVVLVHRAKGADPSSEHAVAAKLAGDTGVVFAHRVENSHVGS